MSKQQVQLVEKMSAVCDGLGQEGGHPRVFLKLDASTHDVTCPYCSAKFKLDPNVTLSGGH